MGTFKIQALLQDVSQKLYDEDGVRWPETELLGDYNVVIDTIGAYKPDVFAQNINFTCGAGTLQVLTGRQINLRRAVRNMGSNGTTLGAAITLVDRDNMDAAKPDWHADTGAAVRHFMLDKFNPRAFYVWPACEDMQLECVMCVLPDVADDAENDDFGPSDEYREAVFMGIMARARYKNFKGGDMAQAQTWLNGFTQFLGLKTQAQLKWVASPAATEQAAEAAGGA